jgi:hypothetical protein
MSLVTQLMKEEGVIEKNLLLQKRISDAAAHFTNNMAIYLNDIQNHPLITEHKETADTINEALLQLMLDVYTADYFIRYCKQPFTISSFLHHKLRLANSRFNITCYASGKKQVVADITNPELYETLKRWRDQLCEEQGLPIYMVANLASLKEICIYLPLNKKDLQRISGFGKAKAEKYGDDILEAVESYCSRHNIETNMSAITDDPKKQRKEKSTVSATPKTESRVISFNLYKEGKAVPEIAKERNLAASTIEGHLASFVSTGEIELDRFVSKEKQSLIKEAAVKHGTESLTALLQNLPDGFTYNEIRMTLASMKAPL